VALLFSDGFDSYAATADLTNKWSAAGSSWTWVSNAGRNGGGAAQSTGTAGTVLRSQSIFSGSAVVGILGWIKISAAPAALTVLIQLKSTVGASIGSLRVNTSGNLAFYGTSNNLKFTGNVNVCNGGWHWFEWYTTQTSSNSGVQKLFVDTVTEFNSTSSSDTTATPDRIEINSFATVIETVDDLIVIDDQGAAPLVSSMPFGMREITTLRPSADGTVQFTRDSGSTNFSRINEVNADGDTSYVQDGTSGHQDLYDFDNLTFSPASITAVMSNAYVENPNPGIMSWRQVAKSVAATTNGSTITAPPNYQIKQQSFPLDPNTSAAWTPANLNAAQFGHNIP
jgi:hypothetical protein